MSATSSCSDARVTRGIHCVALSSHAAALGGLVGNGADEQGHTGRAYDDELEGVPAAQECKQVEPAGAAVFDEAAEVGRGEEVWGGEEHRGDAPFEAAAGADRVEGDVGGHVPAQVVPDAGAQCPEQSDHGRASHQDVLLRRGGRNMMSGPEGTVPEDPQRVETLPLVQDTPLPGHL